jgi:hypothetical protein
VHLLDGVRLKVNLGALKLQHFFALAGVLMLIGAFGTWETIGEQSADALGSWRGGAAFIGGLLIIFGALVSYEILGISGLERRKPFTDACPGALGGLLGIIGAIAHWYGASGRGASAGWGLYLTIVAGLLAIYMSYLIYKREIPAIPRGLSAAKL